MPNFATKIELDDTLKELFFHFSHETSCQLSKSKKTDPPYFRAVFIFWIYINLM